MTTAADKPLQAQYRQLKAQHPDAFLLFRLGDFYELFGADAERAAPLLEVVLTHRAGVPMCGVPHHALDTYLARLLARGHKVAIAEQLEDPATAKGLVRRGVVRVLTPGTVAEPGLLEERAAVRCAAVCGTHLAIVEASTGEFRVAESSDVWAEVARLRPREVLVPPGTQVPTDLGVTVTPWDAFDPDLARRHFGTDAGPAAGGLLSYLAATQGSTKHITRCDRYFPSGFLQLDANAQRNLEITRRLGDGGSGEGTLLSVLDVTLTAMGARQLREWLERPLVDPPAIAARLDAVEELVREPLKRGELRAALRGVYDIERLVGRAATGRATARELVALRRSLGRLPHVAAAVVGCRAPLLTTPEEAEPAAELYRRLDAALDDDAAFRLGYDDLLDELRRAAREGREWLAGLEARERERTGVKNLKVGFNKVFGYYLEVPGASRHLVPADYLRKQTLVGAERFVTPELKELEERILGAEDKAARRETVLLDALRAEVAAEVAALQLLAQRLAVLDCLAALAEVAAREGYVRPVVDAGLSLDIRAGRHPVLERTLGRARFVPNDVALGDDRRFLLITGPNMAGKSTYMRQVALIVLLAQAGSFVPATAAHVGVVDRIFTRVGAADDLAGGRSTFMVEMTEVAALLREASERSLLLLDEVGRGTSTLDGLAIAWAVAEEITQTLGCRTLFATHFHELTAMVAELRAAANVHVAARDDGEGVVFLHRLLPGASDRSYGIHVARLAGVPNGVLARATVLLRDLEANGGLRAVLGGGGLASATARDGGSPHGPADAATTPAPAASGELTASARQAAASADGGGAAAERRLSAVAARLLATDPLRTTPLEALELLCELRRILEEG